jgi:sigma-54 dependent transcriptional regulator, acetoin dehydrogenase operon transcriptional activator AcoR
MTCRSTCARPAGRRPPGGTTLQEIEKAAIVQALQRHRGRKLATARELGVDKNTLRRKMIRLGIRP